MLDELKTSKNSLQKLYTVTKKSYFYLVTNKHSMNRMNLGQLVIFFAKNNLPVTASYFLGCINDNVTVDGWIEADFVKRHIGEGQLFKEIRCEVTTAISCDK